ncbi:multiheme c-type cytochrome [Thalassoroseus pseudoceratinae]|uniref:multiheme c-type cytochrome n=1 Tax=Thalassoroseus pseudoceratinae TaxID=2713176 RepID=UPI00141F1E60|nr:multiheme c-type cytochrome [Thalassoroseus pseudoceratinae]
MSLRHARFHTPRLIRLSVLLLFGGMAGVFIGCEKDSPKDVPPPTNFPSSTDSGVRTLPPPRFKKWDKPTVAVVLSGEQHGYIEPCGCSELLSGGLSRRADLVKQLQEQFKNVVGVDLGGTLERDRYQSQLKFNLTLNVLEDLGYQAIGMGPEELRLGVDTLIGQHQNRLTEQATQEPSFVCANATIYDTPDLSPRRNDIITVGDAKIGITAVISESYRRKLSAADINDETRLKITPPADALADVVPKFEEAGTDFNILLAQTPLKEAEALAKQYPQFAVVLSAEGGDEPPSELHKVGDTLIVQIGRKGKYAGVLAYYADKAEEPFQFELIDLDKKRFENSPLVEKHLRVYQRDIESNLQQVFASLPKSFHPSGQTFVGAETCGKCHTKAFAKWSSTKHAHAYESIVKGREGQFTEPIARNLDTECIGCHVTGWDPENDLPFDSGFLPEQLATAKGEPQRYEHLKGQQCENCHGPGSTHVELEMAWKTDRTNTDESRLKASRRQMTLTKKVAEDRLCIKCHDHENSPKFEFAKYWEEVKHPWRD